MKKKPRDAIVKASEPKQGRKQHGPEPERLKKEVQEPGTR
jgi:hypothetical protein